MSEPEPDIDPAWLDRHAQAEALAVALHRRGITSVLFKNNGHWLHPCVWAVRGTRQEFVYVAPDFDGRWWFWWSTLDRIALAAEVSVTADRVARRLNL